MWDIICESSILEARKSAQHTGDGGGGRGEEGGSPGDKLVRRLEEEEEVAHSRTFFLLSHRA